MKCIKDVVTTEVDKITSTVYRIGMEIQSESKKTKVKKANSAGDNTNSVGPRWFCTRVDKSAPWLWYRCL